MSASSRSASSRSRTSQSSGSRAPIRSSNASLNRRARPFGGLTLARVIDQDAPHHLRRHAEEVRAILPVDAILAGESDVRLVDQGGGLQRVVWPFAAQIGSRRAVAIRRRPAAAGCHGPEGLRGPTPARDR